MLDVIEGKCRLRKETERGDERLQVRGAEGSRSEFDLGGVCTVSTSSSPHIMDFKF